MDSLPSDDQPQKGKQEVHTHPFCSKILEAIGKETVIFNGAYRAHPTTTHPPTHPHFFKYFLDNLRRKIQKSNGWNRLLSSANGRLPETYQQSLISR